MYVANNLIYISFRTDRQTRNKDVELSLSKPLVEYKGSLNNLYANCIALQSAETW